MLCLVYYSVFLEALFYHGHGHHLNIYLGFTYTCNELELRVRNQKSMDGGHGKLVPSPLEQYKIGCFRSVIDCGESGFEGSFACT